MPESQPRRRDSLAAETEDEISLNDSERRRGPDRRHGTLRALLHGSLNPRRRAPRRGYEANFTSVDWHHPQWLGVAMLILILSCADAFLTLNLMDRGAYEINPFMAPLVGGSPLLFTVVKIGLTGGGVVLLTVLARVRLFSAIPISFVLYGVLGAYAVLVIYEFKLLQETLFTP